MTQSGKHPFLDAMLATVVFALMAAALFGALGLAIKIFLWFLHIFV